MGNYEFEPIKKNKKTNKNLVFTALTILMCLGISLATTYFVYHRNDERENIIVSGLVTLDFGDASSGITLDYAVPESDEDGKKRPAYEFTVTNTSEVPVNVKIGIKLNQESTIAINGIRFAFYVDGEEKKVDNLENTGADYTLYTIENLGAKKSVNAKVIFWIDYDYTVHGQVFSAKFTATAESFDYIYEPPVPLEDTIKEAITTNTTETCTPTVTDDNDTPEDPSDDTIYFSGNNTCVNFNYVWYSGKLWRIVAINPDGSMKLVTQDEITAINWGEDTTYKDENKDSWIYQWLNEDFKETLYNYEEIIVQNADWNATADGNLTPVRPPKEGDGIVQGDVGLLNAYEYYQAYKNASTSTNYLNIGYRWWLITPYSGSIVRYVDFNGNLYCDSPSSSANGVRPSINLKSNIGIVAGGDGSETNPYRISGDKEPGNSGELISTRISGEYVEVNNKKYRIVGIEKDENGNNITKLTSVDYVRDTGGAVLTKNFGSNTSWATSVESGSDDYWGYYLNNTNNETFEETWLTEELNKYITEGTYYLEGVGYASYKNSICSESNTTAPTSSCAKTSSTWTGLVGLPRVGEMFSAMLGKGYNDTSTYIWLITPYSGSSVRYVNSFGNLNNYSPSSNAYGVRPSINLKSEIKITEGDGMSLATAYKVGL